MPKMSKTLTIKIYRNTNFTNHRKIIKRMGAFEKQFKVSSRKKFFQHIGYLSNVISGIKLKMFYKKHLYVNTFKN